MGIDGKVVHGNGHTRSLHQPMSGRARTPDAIRTEADLPERRLIRLTDTL
ncbi:hypothetical protein GCM10022284_75550 [Streptomyces hundungensis]